MAKLGAPNSGSHLRSGLVVVALVSLAVAGLRHAGLLAGFEYLALETFQLFAPPSSLKTTVRIIGIGDACFKSRFQGRYPLAAGGVKEIISAVAKGNPKLIAVDLDTSAWSPDDLNDLPTSVPIVWARDMMRADNSYCALPVAGGAKGLYDQYTGLAAVPADADGVVRRYHRVIPVRGVCGDAGAREEPIQSFPWAVATVHQSAKPDRVRQPDNPELVLNFFGDVFDLEYLSAEVAIRSSYAAGSDWAVRGPVTGRIALIGGIYHAARDTHATPRGILSGVQITAQAIESELNHRGLRIVNEGLLLVSELVTGIALVLLHSVSSYGARWLARLLIFAILALSGSWLAFSSAALWANHVPVLAAVFIHEAYQLARANQNLRKKLGETYQAV